MLGRRWARERDLRTTVYDLPLPALLLTASTLDSDEGPAVDMLIAVHESIEGILRAAGDVDVVRVAAGELTLLARRVEVATELARRGAPVFIP